MNGQAYEQLTLSVVDSLVSHSPWLESVREKTMIVTCGRKCSELSETLNQLGFWVRTYLESCELPGGVVAEDLEREGYDVTVFNYEAAAVGAPHRRERVFFVGYSNGTRLQTQGPELQATGFTGTGENVAHGSEPRSGRLSICSRESQQETNDIVRGCKNVSNAEMRWIKREFSTGQKTRRFSRCSWWAVEPDVGRVAYGVPHRVDRLKCLGNAVVPAQAYPIFRGIYLIETKEVQDD